LPPLPVPSIFGDTPGWGHLVDPSQNYHDQAADLYRRAREEGNRFVTTNYILTELVALLTSPLRIPRPRTIAFVASLLTKALTTDPHFEQAGFVRLLKG
jgi:predicted nucleic acid-binding protein